MQNHTPLKTDSPSFDFKKANKNTNRLFKQTERQHYKEFTKYPYNKTLQDFEKFIEFISPNDFGPSKRRILEKIPMIKIDTQIVESFCIKQNRMNELEGEKSQQNFTLEIMTHSFADLEKKNKCIANLYVEKITQGSNGQFLVEMIDRNPDREKVEERFKNLSFSVDDQVAFCEKEGSPIIDAIGSIYKVLRNGIVISIISADQNVFCNQNAYSLVKQDYQAAFNINSQTLNKVVAIAQSSHYTKHVCTGLMETLLRDNLEDKENEAVDLSPYKNLIFSDKALNDDQQKAIKAALSAKDIYLIDGPAGTGKTRVLTEIIYQCVQKRKKVLACAPSSYAVDNLVEKFVGKNIKCCRVGRPGNDDPKINRVSMEELVKRNKRVSTLLNECDYLLECFKATRNPEYLSMSRTNQEILSNYQKNIANVILDYSDVVFTNLQGAGSSLLEDSDFAFDIAIIDECSQATELASWAAILRAKKVVIAGDRMQLSPFLSSPEAKRIGFNFTLFDRLKTRLPKNLRQVLRVQYRMNEKIMEWSNQEFYEGKLWANDTCAQYTLHEYLKKGSSVKESEVPILMLIDTKGLYMEKTQGVSQVNIGEAAIVFELVDYILKNYNMKTEDIGVISPYQGQNDLITNAISYKPHMKGLKSQTVDFFQGKEKEAIIISLVRSNNLKYVGFLNDARRMNVAVTRARRFVAIICDTTTICQPNLPFLKRLVEHFQKHGQVKTVGDFQSASENIDFIVSVLANKEFDDYKKGVDKKENKNWMESGVKEIAKPHLRPENKIEVQSEVKKETKSLLKERLLKSRESQNRSFVPSFLEEEKVENNGKKNPSLKSQPNFYNAFKERDRLKYSAEMIQEQEDVFLKGNINSENQKVFDNNDWFRIFEKKRE